MKCDTNEEPVFASGKYPRSVCAKKAEGLLYVLQKLRTKKMQ